MPNNIFLSGDDGSGKSTIIKNVIQELGLNSGGFIIKEIVEEERDWTECFLIDARVLCGNNQVPELDPENIVARRQGDETWHIRSSVYDKKGVELLARGFVSSDILVIDRLGEFELKANVFINKIEGLLDTPKPVLGAVNVKNNPFINNLMERRDCEFFVVSKESRERVYNEVLERVKDIL
ncbi:nucleotide kinase [Halothermothrix orenii]|uniref:Nucleotide kinase n=1 Tax=Halothermothrix orenii (strain H 168 / OCM 544 / DSM 9562) TaxID=373903 RepID=B8CZM3_HALOH|nr:nucleotide kinase [Halothermothrix orenii]ACL70742.1 nucleotide kinase [Halothermothrix orenii H 168]